jgi:hypothetical protein
MNLSLPFSQARRAPQVLGPATVEERLLSCADKVLSEWALLTPRKNGQASDRPSADQVHAVVDLVGPQHGMLSVSCPQRVGAMLAVAATGDPGAGGFANEAVLELCMLLRETLLSEVLGADGRDYLLQAARWSQHDELPAHAPAAALRLSVNGYCLELRLWLD